jgi:hypothetical protein
MNIDKMTKAELMALIEDLQKQLRLLQDEYRGLRIAYDLSNRVHDLRDTPGYGMTDTPD